MATIKDVARRAGVSASTISKYLNGGAVRPQNVEAIKEAITALNYRVNPFARNMRSQRSPAIGILLPDMAAPFYGSVVMTLDKLLREQGYHSIISVYGSNYGLERDNLRFLINNGIDGLVYIPEDILAEEFEALTANCHIPTVLVDRMIQGVQADAVLVDNTEAVYQAIGRLVDKGHQRIAVITGPKSVFTAKERLAGYLRALQDHGIIYDDSLVISDQNTFATGYRGCNRLMNLPDPPTAVFCTNYDITIGLVTAARERGIRVPEDLDVFGFDCVEICTMMKTPLPVVHQPEREIGRRAAMYLLERLEGYDGPARTTRLQCDLVMK